MSGISYCLDTNILIYLLDGDKSLAAMLNRANFYISVITEMELLSYPDLTPAAKENIQELLAACTIIDLNPTVKNKAIEIRRTHRLKLPDAIVAATADYLGLPLFTADKQMDKVEDLSVMLYEF